MTSPAPMPKRRPVKQAQHRGQGKKPGAGFASVSLGERLGGRMAWLFAALLGLTTAVLFRDFLWPIKSYLFRDIGSDTINSLYPQLDHIAAYLRRWGLPAWSFNQGMGQNIYPDSLGDPFNWLLYLLGPARVAYGLAYVAVLKVLIAGALFYAYLRLRRIERFAASIVSLCYAFCGTMILGGTWYVYSTTAVYAPIALIACECLLQRRRTWVFPLTVALIAALNPIYIWLFGIFVVVYLMVRYLEHDARDTLTILQLALRAAGLGLLGIAIAAVFVLPSALTMLQSPRGGGPASARSALLHAPVFALGAPLYYASIVLRSFSSDMLGTGSSFRGWSNYAESPMHYCGLLSLLLAPQLFSSLAGRVQAVIGALAAGALLVYALPWLRHAFWLFSGDWFRTLSLFLSILLLLFSARALHAVVVDRSCNPVLLIGTCALLLALLYFPYTFQHDRGNPVNEALQDAAAAFLVIETILLLALSRPNLRMAAEVGLLITVPLELILLSSPSVNDRPVISIDELGQRTGYADQTIDALRLIHRQDPGFFRVEKNYSSSPAAFAGLNDAKVQGYFGTSSFHSFNQPNYIRFLAGMGVIDPTVPAQTSWAPGLARRPVLDAFASVKYWLFRGDYRQAPFLSNTTRLVDSTGQVQVLENKYFIPLGFGLGRYASESQCRALSVNDRDAVLLEAFVIPDSAIAHYSRFARWDSGSGSVYGIPEYIADARRCAQNAMSDLRWDQNRIEGSFSCPTPQILVLSIPFDAGWTARLDGKITPLRRIDFGLTGLEIDPGRHSIALRYRPPLVREGLVISVAGLLALAGIGVVSRRRPLPPNC